MADTATHSIERTMNHMYAVLTVAGTPDDRYIITGSGLSIIKLDRRTGQTVKRRENAHNGVVCSLYTEGTLIVSCSYHDDVVKVWNMECRHLPRLHDDRCRRSSGPS